MSIASEIQRLYNIKALIRTALVNKGITSASTHDMEDFPDDIDDIQTGGTYQSKTVSPTTSQQTVSPDSGYDALSSVTVNAIQTQTKSATPTTSAQTITPDSGKYLTSVSVGAIQTQTKSASPSTSAQTITPDSGKYLSSVSISAMNLQTKSVQISPSADWSSAWTSATAISPDSGKDGMTQVNVQVPMCRDNMLMTASAVSTPSTVYNGDTAQSNSQKLLRIGSTKSGMVYTNSYLYVQPNSYLGNAAASDVASGKTFSSSNGIQVTGTATPGIDTSDATAYAANVVSPYTFYARGNKYTGSITPRSLTTGSNLGYSRIDSGYYSNSYSVSANSPMFESIYMSSSRQTSLTATYSVSQSPGDLTMIVLSTSNTDYTEDVLQTTGGAAQGILAIGFIPSIDIMYVEFELRFNVSGTNYTATVSYSSGQYTVTLNSLPASSYRPYFQVYRVMNKGFSLS